MTKCLCKIYIRIISYFNLIFLTWLNFLIKLGFLDFPKWNGAVCYFEFRLWRVEDTYLAQQNLKSGTKIHQGSIHLGTVPRYFRVSAHPRFDTKTIFFWEPGKRLAIQNGLQSDNTDDVKCPERLPICSLARDIQIATANLKFRLLLPLSLGRSDFPSSILLHSTFTVPSASSHRQRPIRTARANLRPPIAALMLVGRWASTDVAGMDVLPGGEMSRGRMKLVALTGENVWKFGGMQLESRVRYFDNRKKTESLVRKWRRVGAIVPSSGSCNGDLYTAGQII